MTGLYEPEICSATYKNLIFHFYSYNGMGENWNLFNASSETVSDPTS